MSFNASFTAVRSAAVVFLSGVLVACGSSSGSNSVNTPNVVGQSQGNASSAISSAGLAVGTVTMQSSTTVASGVVISESPAAGSSAGRGTAVNLVVSSGPPTVAAPSLTGDTQTAASAALTSAGLTLGTVTMQSSTSVATGKVITQTPSAGTSVVVGSSVNLVISSGVVISGVVASGYAVANGPGYALDAATGTQIPFVTDANGNYSVDLYGYAGPYLLHVLGTSAGGGPVDLYSLASSSNAGSTINVTPLSDVVLAYAAGVTTQNLESACTANQSACPALLNSILANLSNANSAVVAVIPASVFSAFGITPSTFNAITSQFTVTHTGVDGLLDALSVIPPVTSGGSYTISLLGASTTPVATIPTSGTAGTQGSAPSSPGAPAAAAVTQAANLASVQGEIHAFFASITALWANSVPTAAQAQALMTQSFLHNGLNAAAQAALITSPHGQPQGWTVNGGSMAPYSGAPFTGSPTPAAAVTFDSNNCVTAIWVYISGSGNPEQLTDTIPTSNAAGVCTGGTWLWAGNGRTYTSELIPRFVKNLSQLTNGTTTYSAGLALNLDAFQTTANTAATVTPYSFALVSGPGITTVGAPTATPGGLLLLPPASLSSAAQQAVLLIANTKTYSPDPYYAGTNLLKSCADILAGSNTGYDSNTPCFNSNSAAGSDYTIKFFALDSSNNTVLLSKQMERLNISVGAVSLPTTYYPTITAVTPASASSITAGVATTVTTTWTVPAGGVNDAQGMSLSGSSGLLFGTEFNMAPGATTNSISVPALSSAPTSGRTSVSIVIGGLNVDTAVNF